MLVRLAAVAVGLAAAATVVAATYGPAIVIGSAARHVAGPGFAGRPGGAAARVAVSRAGRPEPAGDPTGGPPASFDFRDCPPLPAGVQRGRWRCEVLVATGWMRLGNIDVPAVAPITVTHAEGPRADGTTGQVFGRLRAERTEVPGGLLARRGHGGHNPLLHLGLRMEYAGYADLVDRAAMDVRLRLVNPLLGDRCAIGDPVRLSLLRDGPSQWISRDPPLVKFSMYDQSLALPAAHGCRMLTHLVDHRFGLPAPAGANEVYFTAYYTFKTYDRLN
jgi:hypothetical protein